MKYSFFIVILECFSGFANLNDGCGISIGGAEAENGSSRTDILEELSRAAVQQARKFAPAHLPQAHHQTMAALQSEKNGVERSMVRHGGHGLGEELEP